jgi:hypothetical protein
MQNNIKDGIQISMICELIGSSFQNDELDVKYNKKINTFTPYIFEYIAYGGFSNYNTSRMKMSKYTLLAYHLNTVILNSKENELIDNIIAKQKYLNSDTTFRDAPGFLSLSDSVTVCMICSLIGIKFYNDSKKMEKYCLMVSQISQKEDAISDLGGLTSAFITASFMKKVNVDKIPGLLLEYLSTLKLHSTLIYKKNVKVFIDTWNKYYENRFRNNKPVRNEANLISHIMSIPFKRTNFYVKNFCDGNYPGLSSLDLSIIAYDCLLDAESNFERFIYYCCLHNGNRASTGMLGGLWYGLVFGKEKVPKYLIEHMEKLVPLYNVV